MTMERVLQGVQEKKARIVNEAVSEANDEAKAILTSARQDADKEISRQENDLSRQVDMIINRATSAARLQGQRMVLSAKRDILKVFSSYI